MRGLFDHIIRKEYDELNLYEFCEIVRDVSDFEHECQMLGIDMERKSIEEWGEIFLEYHQI